jgi:hypothetical protein
VPPLRQVGEGVLGRHGRYLPTVARLTSMPSLSNSPGCESPPERVCGEILKAVHGKDKSHRRLASQYAVVQLAP